MNAETQEHVMIRMTRTYVNSQPVAVAAQTPSRITSKISAHPGGTLIDVNVSLDLEHTYTGDLTITLISPNGTRIQLASRRGGSADDFRSTTFDDGATTSIAQGTAPFRGRFTPEESLGQLAGESPNGLWSLEISDAAAGDGGSLNAWTLTLVVERTQLAIDPDLLRLKEEQLVHAEAALKVYKYFRCVRQGGGFGDVETLLRCGGFNLPDPPHPAEGRKGPALGELLLALDDDEQVRVGNALLEAQDHLLEGVMAELAQLDVDNP